MLASVAVTGEVGLLSEAEGIGVAVKTQPHMGGDPRDREVGMVVAMLGRVNLSSGADPCGAVLWC